jgi:uncharacterized protein (DUF952 family)
MVKFIYKICDSKELISIKKKNIFYGTKKDKSDGYIHFSKKNQTKSTLKRYYSNKKNLFLLKVSTLKLKKLVWEKSRGDEFFPHLYSYLVLKNIKKVYKIVLKNNDYKFILQNF